MKKILIVGGAGYIGRFLYEVLSRNHKNITILDNLTYEKFFLNDFHFINCDIRDTSRILNIAASYDIVIWLAAIVGDPACAINPNLTHEINHLSVKRFIKRYKKKFIFISTCSVYGKSEKIIDESSTNFLPQSEYAESKIRAERDISKYSKNYCIIRLGTIFGISSNFSRLRMDLFINLLTYKAYKNETLEIYGGSQFRPILHVKDVAYAIEFIINKNIKGVYNLSCGNFKIIDVAKKIVSYIRKGKIKYSKVYFQDNRNYRVSNNLIKSLGWKPKYNLRSGVIELFNLYNSEKISDYSDPYFNNHDFLSRSSIFKK